MPALNSTDSLKALLQHKTRVQRTLSESFAALTAAGNWEALNESLLKECVKALNAQAAFIIVPKENELRVVAADDLINALFQDTDYAALKDAASIAIQRHKNLLFAESPEKRAGGRSMICVPVFSGEGKPLAVLGVFGRAGGGAFTEADAEVLTAVALSAGAAIEKIGLKIELALKYKEIEFMNRINRYTTSIRDLRELLEAVLGEMTKALGAEMGVVLLKESETAKKFEVAGATDVARKEFEHTSFELPKTLAIDAVKSLETKRLKKVNNIISSALLQPVAEDGVVVGVFALFNKRGGESEYFTVEDALLFASLVKQAHSALFQEEEKRRLKDLFLVTVPKEFVKKAVEGKKLLSGENILATMLMSDLRGFTRLTEIIDPDEMITLLNEYFEEMSKIIFKNKGNIIRFIGDAIQVCFGLSGEDDHEKLAVKTGLEMQAALKKLNEKWRKEDHKAEFKMGIGINTGMIFAGNVGSEKYVNFACMGDTTNTSSRISSVAKEWEVLVSESTYYAVKRFVKVEAMEPVQVKGKEKPLQLYKVLEFSSQPTR